MNRPFKAQGMSGIVFQQILRSACGLGCLTAAPYRSLPCWRFLPNHTRLFLLSRHHFHLLCQWLLAWITLIWVCGCDSTRPARPAARLWTNSLGMTFGQVPVVSRDQPEAARARQILVAALETTAEQMALFRAEPAQESAMRERPAQNVSWLEAVAFCDWLTNLERSRGKITARQRYRLPTDHEWSCAAGIGHLESASGPPEGKSNGIADRYPWGTAWPPPAGAGNLCGTESKRDYPGNYITGYKDRLSGGVVRSRASVANEFGLHDLSGNVWEWCAEHFREGRDWRVLRGGSWKTARPQTLLSSHRTHDPESYRSDSVGFRCVLVSE